MGGLSRSASTRYPASSRTSWALVKLYTALLSWMSPRAAGCNTQASQQLLEAHKSWLLGDCRP